MQFTQDIITQLIEDGSLSEPDHSITGGIAGLLHGLFSGPHAPGIGGLADLVKRFEKHGLGPIVHSWTDKGPILPVTPRQLHAVLGHEVVAHLANVAETTEDAVLQSLSLLLPGVISRLAHRVR